MKKKIIILLFIVMTSLFVTACSIKSDCNCDCNNIEEKEEQINNKLKGKEFIRTYNINYIAESNDYDYIYITIRAFQDEEIETVKVKRSLFKDFEVGDNCEITFKIINEKIQDNLKSIFENTEIINVNKTDKTGLEQVFDEFLK